MMPSRETCLHRRHILLGMGYAEQFAGEGLSAFSFSAQICKAADLNRKGGFFYEEGPRFHGTGIHLIQGNADSFSDFPKKGG